MSDNNELPLKLLSKCINCDLKFTNEFKGFKTIKLYTPSQQHQDTLQSTADEENLLANHHCNDNHLVEEIKIEVIDAISYIHGVSYQHLLFSYLKSNWKSLLSKNGHCSTTISVEVNDSNVAVAMCFKCANLFERLYKVFKDFDKASSTHSILKGAIKSFRDECRVTNSEKFDSKNPNSFQVKLEITDRDDDMENDSDMNADPFYDSDSINEDSNSSLIFQEAEVKKEEVEDPLQGLDVDYMTRCKVVLDRLDSQASSEKNDVSNSTGDVLLKRTRKQTFHVLPELDSENLMSNDVSNSTGDVLLKRTRKRTYHVLPELDSANLLKRRQQLKTKVNENTLYLRNKNLFRNKMNSSSSRFYLVWCCGIRFVREKEFLEHKNERHNGQDEFPCEYCQKVIPINMMSKHLFKTHKIKFNKLNNSQTKEKVVDNTEVDRDNECILDENEKDIDTKELWRGYTCEFCETVMYFFDEYESHMTQHDKTEMGKVIFPYICCKVSLPDNKALAKHRYEKHNKKVLKVQCQFCQEFVVKPGLKLHLKSQHNYVEQFETFKCPKCGLGHGSMKSLARHQTTRWHQMEFTCGIDNCKKVYYTEVSMAKHKRLSHIGELKYPCSFCGKLFRNQGAKISHQDGHELEHHIVCDECGKTFKTKTSYRRHRLKHRDAKLGRENFKCADCDKCFVDRLGLKKHITIFHREDMKRIFTCEQCGKTTNNMTNMRIHQRIHDPNRILKSNKKSP